jgi:ABC-type transporter Mla maintaining outer membrane lipid asymmetry permease subunit MlaE
VFIGIILALQLARRWEDYGSLEKVADIIGLAMLRRRWGPVVGGVLSGFAGASIAREIGAMVESERSRLCGPTL